MILQLKTQDNRLVFRDLPVRFPFRVCYAVTKDQDQETLLQTLRYAIVCPLTDILIQTLKRLISEGERSGEGKLRPETLDATECAKTLNLLDVDTWVLVVPVYPEYTADFSGEEYNGRKPLTRAFRQSIWQKRYNPIGVLPKMALRLPERTIPNMCVACLRVIDMQAGTCSPGDSACQQNMTILIKDGETYHE